MKPLERDFQKNLIKEIKHRLPDAIVKKNDAGYIQGIPDLTVEYGPVSYHLEVKRSKNASRRPNQGYYIDKYNSLGGFASIVYPENREEVLNEVEQSLRSGRDALISKRLSK